MAIVMLTGLETSLTGSRCLATSSCQVGELILGGAVSRNVWLCLQQKQNMLLYRVLLRKAGGSGNCLKNSPHKDPIVIYEDN